MFNDKFYATPIRELLSLILKQEEENEIFGIPKELFFKPEKDDFFQTKMFNQKLHSPIGVAAGPHTQLSQNIIASWLTGARFIELKTVQTLDELEVAKPCIDMQEEGYNCEWSQELKIHKSFNEYLNAWILIHILKDKFDYPEIGTILNMSVGYDYNGIMEENVQWFFSKMNNCKTELDQKIEEIKDLYPRITEINIPHQISDNITLSTMHGCPSAEIEKIGHYLITDKGLNTTIKLNPTLLGEDLRTIIKNAGYNTDVPDIAFEHDLKYPDALQIIKNLRDAAKQKGVFFGIKLTNTLENKNNRDIFGKESPMMYMSGKALHPISINVARKLQNEFNGELNVSFSGGADAFNVSDILACNIYPITVSSDLLKPGGYGRLYQYFEELRANGIGTTDLQDYIAKKSENNPLAKLNSYADEVLENEYYKKESFSDKSIKTDKKLELFDCISAPCVTTCPTTQHIPQYLYFTAKGEYEKAFKTIIETNATPMITGMVCDHICQYKCTRINYDTSLQIRDIKRFVTEYDTAQNHKNLNISENNIKVAIVGAGPAGLSAAYYLRLQGFDITIYEAKEKSGGMVANAIPAFRIEDEDIEIDVNRVTKMGVKIIYNHKIDFQKFENLRTQNKYVFIAVGANATAQIRLEGLENKGIIDTFEFLFKTKKDNTLDIGKKVAVIGGGNTAMDVARISKRLVGKDGDVKIVYRRTKSQMPAFYLEIAAAIEEGVDVMELVSPEKILSKDGKVTGMLCSKMELGEKDKSGRPRPVKIPNSEFEMEFDTIIPAVGQDLDINFIDNKLLAPQDSTKTQIENVFIGGDALDGASSIISAVADGREVAETIIKKENPSYTKELFIAKKEISLTELKIKKAKRIPPVKTAELDTNERNNFKLISTTYTPEEAKEEADRCLYCDELCNICVTVCPNLANMSYEIEPFAHNLKKIILKGEDYQIVADKEFKIEQKYQVANIADWCNECGNCSTFCPTSGNPYLDKPKLHISKQSYIESPSGYYVSERDNNKIVFFKKDGESHKLVITNNYYLYGAKDVFMKINKLDFSIAFFEILNLRVEQTLDIPVEMSIIAQIKR